MNDAGCGEFRNEAAPGGAVLSYDKCPPPPTPAVGKLSYKISIEDVANGFIARVGCQTFVFSSLRDMLEALELYYTDPDAATKKYLIGDKK